MNEHASDVVVVDLPRYVYRPWEIGLVAGGLAGVAGLLLWSHVRRAGPVEPVVLWVCGVLAAGSVVAGCVLLVHRWRLVRRSRGVMARAAAGEPVEDGALCVCAAVLAGAGRGRARALTRAHVEAVEDASGRALPRVWIDGRRTLRALTREVRPGAAGPAVRLQVRAASAPRPWHARLRWPVMVALGLVAHAWLRAGALSGFWPMPTGAWGMFLVAATALVLYAPVEFWFRRAGWWLDGDVGGVWLRRTGRDGEEDVEPVPLDPASCVVVISRPNSSHDDLDGGVAWLFIPPGPARSAEASGVDPRATPWAAVLDRARELEAARGAARTSGGGG